MELQFNTEVPCTKCADGTFYEQFKGDETGISSVGYRCIACGTKVSIADFPPDKAILPNALIVALFRDYYPVWLTRTLHKNEVAKNGRQGKEPDLSLFTKGAQLLRRKGDNEERRKKENNGNHYMIRGKKKTTLPKLSSEWAIRRSYLQKQMDTPKLRDHGAKGSDVGLVELQVKPRTCIAAKVFTYNEIGMIDTFYIPLTTGSKKPSKKK